MFANPFVNYCILALHCSVAPLTPSIDSIRSIQPQRGGIRVPPPSHPKPRPTTSGRTQSGAVKCGYKFIICRDIQLARLGRQHWDSLVVATPRKRGGCSVEPRVEVKMNSCESLGAVAREAVEGPIVCWCGCLYFSAGNAHQKLMGLNFCSPGNMACNYQMSTLFANC